MSTINIPLQIGENYISFPEYSNKSFTDLFTDSGIINNVIGFYKYDPVVGSFISVNSHIEFIEQGRGYLLIIDQTINPIPIITYEGIAFPILMSFDILKSMLFNGWNLIGIDSVAIVSPNWCRFIDASTRMQVSQLYPGKAYWVKYPDECEKSDWIIEYNVPVMVSIAMFFLWSYIYLIRDSPTKKDIINMFKELSFKKIIDNKKRTDTQPSTTAP